MKLEVILLSVLVVLVTCQDEVTDEVIDSTLRTNNFHAPLCVVCKCELVEGGSKDQFDLKCKEPIYVELSREDSWPGSVRSLAINYAKLEEMPKLPNRRLQSFSLSHNMLTSLPEGGFESFGLRELYLGYNGLEEINPTALKGLDDLEVLGLQHNELQFLDLMVFESLTSLQKLYLQDNTLREIGNFSKLPTLKVLNMSGNALEMLPEEFCSGMPALEMLFLSNNRLSTVPSCLLQFKSLQELILDGNPISQVQDGAFATLASLQTLSLSRMPDLHEVDGAALRGLVQLKQLRMSHNPGLESVHSNLLVRGEEGEQHDLTLTYVDLSYNSLHSLPNDLAPWEMLETLNLQGNPWECECTAQWMLNSLVPILYNKDSALLEDVRCASPPRHVGRRLVHWLDRESEKGVWCEEDDRPAPLTQITVIQSGSSYGMLIALASVAGLGLFLLGVGFILQRRYDARRKDLATQQGRCRNPRNGSVRLTHPKLEI